MSKKFSSVVVQSIAGFLVFCQLANGLANGLVITDCSNGASTDAEFGEVRISNCSASDDACTFIRGLNATIEVDFKTSKQFNKATVDVAGKLGVWIPFQINPNEACGNYGFQCPVQADQSETFKLALAIQQIWPKLKLDVRLRLYDQGKNLIFCLKFPAKIRDPSRARGGRVPRGLE